MGETIVACLDMVDKYGATDDTMSMISKQYGDMFTAIAEEYAADQLDRSVTQEEFDELYDMESYEAMLKDLEEAGVI